MNIVFFCQSCGARFEVPPSHAGKHGKCRSCGQQMTIPRAEALASMTALPAVAAAAPAPAAKANAPFRLSSTEPASEPRSRPARPAAVSAAPVGWIDAVNSRVGLAPISVPGLAALAPKKPIALDALADDSRSALYAVVSAPERPVVAAGGAGRPNVLQAFWRGQLGTVQRLMRWVNDASYLVSIPFLFLILLGAVIPNRGLALIGATLVVLLNIGRLVTGLVNLVAVPFREGIAQGILFLIPPMTFVYLSKHWKKLHRSVKRIIEPAITIALVFLAFTFVPSLSGGKGEGGPLLERLKASATELSGEMRGEVERAKSSSLDQLSESAKAKLLEVQGQLNERMTIPIPGKGAASPAGDGSAAPGVDRDKAIDAIEERLRQRSKSIQDEF